MRHIKSGWFTRFSLQVTARLSVSVMAYWSVLVLLLGNHSLQAAPLQAGAAKIDISRVERGPLESPLFAKALVIKSEATTAVLVTLDVVSFGEIGSIPNDFIANVRARARKELGLRKGNMEKKTFLKDQLVLSVYLEKQ